MHYRCRLLHGGITAKSALLHGAYDYRLAIVSSMLATLASYAALDVAARLRVLKGRSRLRWLIWGSIAIGMGIACAYYSSMLALSLPAPIIYRYPSILFALVAAIIISAVFLITLSRPQMTVSSWVLGSILMGGSFAAMYSTALAAIVAPAQGRYRWSLLATSFIFAVLISVFALLLGFRERSHAGLTTRRLFTAFILGCGIHLSRQAVMLVLALGADRGSFSTHQRIGFANQTLDVPVSALAIMLLAIITTLFDRARIQGALDKAVQRNEARFQTLAEAIPQIVWIADANGHTTYLNKHWYELTGTPEGEDLGEGWVRTIHPDDRGPCFEKWQKCIAQRDGAIEIPMTREPSNTGLVPAPTSKSRSFINKPSNI